MADPTLDEIVADFAAARGCPTVVWGVVEGGELTRRGAFGETTVDTVYRIASMTKSFTAATVLLLRDDGIVTLDEPISTYAPELARLRSPSGDAPAITLRHLLTMSSGMVSDDPWADRHLDLTDDEFDRIVAAGPVFAHPTGTAFEYSNFGFAVVGRVVARATGATVQAHVTERLLEPLGMLDTTWSPPEHDRWAPPLRQLDGRFVAERPPVADGVLAPMGGLWTTIADLARWVAWLDDAFPPRDDPDSGPLSRASRRELQTSHRFAGVVPSPVDLPSSYGLGLRIVHDPARGEVVTHSGGLPGYGSNMRWIAGARSGVVAMSNGTYAPMGGLTWTILGEVAPAARREPSARLRSAAERLIALLNDWDDAVAGALFADNVLLDDDAPHRRSGVAPLVPIHLAELTATDDGHASLRCTSAPGPLTIDLTLALPTPDQIQSYEITPPPPPPPA